MKSFHGKVAFVTGAAGGIGLALATALGNRGMKVMLADVDATALEVARNSLLDLSIEAECVRCDVSKLADVQMAAKATLEKFGKIHFVVNNAGVSVGGPTGDIAIEDWNWIVNINLMGVVHGVETFAPIFSDQGEGGFILNTASMAGHLAMAGAGPYNATKYAVVGYSETIRQELGPQGIGVSVLCPGWVRTSINETSRDRPSLKKGGQERKETDQDKQVAAAIDTGLDPAVVADWTLKQIEKDRFYIFTQQELQPFVDGRFAEIKSDLESSREIRELALNYASKLGEEPLDVLVIGAGFSGICAAIQLSQNGISNFQVYDKCEGIGGTWWLNTYPGAACDIPSHFYCYSFEMNSEWSRHFAPQAEIQKYIEHCSVKYGVKDRINLGYEITSIIFDDEKSLWATKFLDGTTVYSRFVINGAGGLHLPKIPTIEGQNDFSGAQIHTARWDHTFCPKGKRIAVIGSAASAIQVVPQLAKVAKDVTLFQRTPNYIAPRNDNAYSEKEKIKFRSDPTRMQAIRNETFEDRDIRLFPIVINPALRKIAAKEVKTFIRSQVSDVELQNKLMPDYEMGCKRILISDDFLPSLNRDNVHMETGGISKITPHGIEYGSGNFVEVDAIIYATGFDLESHKYGFDLIGPEGTSLSDVWKHQSSAYKSAMIPPMPNYFMVTGPNAGVGTTSVVFLVEQSVAWIIEMIKLAGRDKLISVKEEACTQFSEDLQKRLGGTVWASGCDSWYFSANGRNESLFPGTAQDFADQMKHVDLEDFIISEIPGRQNVLLPEYWAPLRDNVCEVKPQLRTLDPTIKAILSSPDVQKGPKMQDMAPNDARILLKSMIEKLEAPISIDCDVENLQMDLKGRNLDSRIYRSQNKPLDGAAMVYFHGGGWVVGDLDTHDNTCRAIADRSGVTVISVDYRRAPEHPFPIPIQDGYDAFIWITKNADKLSIDPEQIGIGGDSAGGNIATVVTHMLRDKGGPRCAWQALLYPSTAANYLTQSAQDYAEGYGLDAALQEWFGSHYIPEEADMADPRLSPLMSDSFHDLPPAFIATAGFDPLRDAGLEYSNALKSSGVTVSYVEYPDLIHGFNSWAGIVPSAGAALTEIAGSIGQLAKTTALTLNLTEA